VILAELLACRTAGCGCPFLDRGAARDSACRQARRAVTGEAAFSRWPGMGWRWRVGLCAGGGGFVGVIEEFCFHKMRRVTDKIGW